jgi:hypothetical protein
MGLKLEIPSTEKDQVPLLASEKSMVPVPTCLRTTREASNELGNCGPDV